MKNFIKNCARIIFSYSVSLIIFSIFIYVFLSITKDKFNVLLPYYCIFVFIIAFFIIYTDMKQLGIKEKKPQYNDNPYPLKGLVYGVVGFAPFILLELLSVIIRFNDQFTDHIKHVFINIVMGPLYFIIRFFGESTIGYILASAIIPLVAMLGYLAGYYGFDIIKHFKKTKLQPMKPKFTKSPWNPTNTTKLKSSTGKKKTAGRTTGKEAVGKVGSTNKKQ